MFNFWVYFFIMVIAASLLVLIKINTPYAVLLVSEFNWICFIVVSILLAQLHNDSRFFTLTYLFLFVAAVEIVLYIIYGFSKKLVL